ncbi:unnamed protein product [Kuraishia capsulata CBS 1993]|uniref:Peroxisomal adenine nucleotide transporter 1 n=1 Tax=Kuraishia capsulata CBS 1993 TaxID=1382522 RepID=W6MGA4_9ASCO|nr:uncharacterized protein KUCA_T00001036001 [Kuraishia capsulata CBS 1993]CDK25069.1 unnamed protein product [Kuraishia capsulata CBS 1993]
MSRQLSPSEKALFGCCSAILSNAAVYPLDLVKAVIQTQSPKEKYADSKDALRQIYKREGVKGWYKGINSSLLSTAVTSYSYFYMYNLVKRSYQKFSKSTDVKVFDELAMGVVAAALSQLLVTPLSVITTEQQTQSSKDTQSAYEVAESIVSRSGITGLWKGLKVSLVLTLNPSITYGSFENLKSIFYKDRAYLKPQESFLLGVLSKVIATLITQPLIVSKAMLQKHKSLEEEESERPDTFQGILVYLWKTEGFAGLWKGLRPQLLKGVLVQGLLFMFKDQIELLFLSLFKIITARKQLRAAGRSTYRRLS